MRYAVLSLILVLSLAAVAQPRTSETIEVSIINVDVVVTDRDGKRVTGLTANDFEIREAGKKKAITNFAEYGATVTAGEASIEGPRTMSAALPRAPRTVVLFVEWVQLPPHVSKRIYEALRGVAREAVGAGDRVMIVGWYSNQVAGRKLVERLPFTDDLGEIDAVLAKMEQEHAHGPRDLSDELRREQEAADAEASAIMTAGGALSSEGPTSVHRIENALRERSRMKQKIAALETLMHSISGFEGRKIMLMAVQDFGLFAGGAVQGENVALERRQEFSNATLHDSLVRTANATGVTLYPIYPQGLVWQPNFGSIFSTPAEDVERKSRDENKLFNQAMALEDIATRTGGLAAWGAGNIADMLPRMADDLETYYSLGYRAPGTSHGIARKIEVVAKNRAYKVRTRAEFVEKSDEEAVKDRVIANLYQASAGSVPFEVEPGQARSTGRNRWELPIRVRIPIQALTTLPDGEKEVGEFSVYAASGSVVGVMSDVQRRSQPFSIPKEDLGKAKESHFTYDFALQLDDKANRLSIAVVDETGQEIGLKQIDVPARVH
jgi:VWFA-related protein